MKYQKTNDAKGELVLDSFCGLDRSAALCGGKGSFELRNLRCMKDGTLARRPGLVPLLTFPEAVRGAVSVRRGGGEEWYVVAGDTVYVLSDTSGGCTATPIGTLTTKTGAVSFLCHDAVLLLRDGAELYAVTSDALHPVEAYAPLYGKEWQSGDVTTHIPNERPNLLSRRLRVQYRMTEKSQSLALRSLTPESVDAILVNGEPYAGNFSYNKSSKMIYMGRERR